MIREDTKQAWVTLALSDLEAFQALVLAKSLEQTYTTRKICIFISEAVTREMKYLLMQVFHSVLTVSNEELEGLDAANHGLSSTAKLWCWTMKQFVKCVFLSPDMLMAKNCDELFKYEQLSAAQHKESKECFDTSVFVFRPDFKTFEELSNIAGTQKSNADVILNTCFKSWQAIDTKHLLTISRNQITRESTKSDEWLQVYFQHILPLFKCQTKKFVRDLLTAIQKKYNLPQADHSKIQSPVFDESFEDYNGTVAVVGMSCRFPGANNAQEYWKLLSEGREAIRRFPSDRPFLGKPQAREMEAGFLNCAIDEFDAKFFGISPREALLVDPQQRLLLEVTWESLEHAGINPQTLRDSDTGVYVGMWQQDYERIILESKKSEDTDETIGFLHIFLGNKYSATASRISFCLGLNGPAIAVESGCSSSLNGLHLACESLQSGETSLALVSGVNLILLPFNPFSGKAAGEESVVLSKDYRCKTFDESADGFVRAEACGVVVLKRFEDARRDGDNILAIVKGSAVNNDGTGTSFGTPNEKAQEKVYRAALTRANVNPADVSYIETHGTGTAVGDPIEMYAVGQAYSENRTNPLLVGSVKTNIGHCEAAAGIASLIKVILCMEHGAIPPHLNLKTLNPRIDLTRIPAQIPMELTPWKVPKRIAAISSFSMSATNAHVILQEPPKLKMITQQDHTKSQDELITISAKSEQALTDLCRMYVHYLENNTEKHQLSDIAYSANTGRAHLQHRIAVVASNTAQLLSRLDNNNYVIGKASTLKGKIGFLFTGQGSQYTGMAKGLSETFPAFQKALARCNNLFQTSLNQNLDDVLFNDESLLNQTLYCQPAIFCLQYCLHELWNFYGIKPDYVLGHSVGEFAAAVCAGILTLEDAMKLVVARSKLVNGLPSGNMTAIRASDAKVVEMIKLFSKSGGKNTWIDVAAVNSPEEVVISGNEESVKGFEKFCLNNGIQSVSIPATHAFHSRDMEPVLVEFGKIAATVAVGTPSCVYVSGTLARALDPMEFGSHYWQRHLRDSVKYSDAIRLVWAECKTLVEIGPQPILLGLTMATVDDSTNSGAYIPSLRRKDDASTSFYAAMSKLYVSGTDFDWPSVYGVRQKMVNLPLYPFQRQKYWYVDELSKDDELTPLLHPLLGRQFLSPLPDLLFCQTYRLKELDYMEDHKVADYVIVPVAALLESFMAASREVLQGGSQNRFPITIENLVVEAALPLEKSCRIQTLVSSDARASAEDNLNYKLSLNRKMENHFDKWKRHAHAVFIPSSTLPDAAKMDLESLKARLNHRESLESSYKAIADVGIQFGPRFQSVASAWYGPAELLTEIHLPAQHEEYICHPIVLDAMIQTSALREYLTQTMDPQDVKKALYLPISIRKFTWLSRVSTPTVYAHSSGQNGNVTMYTSDGEPLGIMEGLELLQTTISSVVRAIRADSLEVPDFMCDRWRSVLGKTSSRVDISKMIPPSIESPNVAENKETVKGFTKEEVSDAKEGMETNVFLTFVTAVHECGWPWPAVGDFLLAESWQVLLPSTMNKGIIGIYLCELERRGFLKSEGSGWKVLKPLLTCAECRASLADFKERSSSRTELDAEFRMHDRYSSCLVPVLQGKMTPLALLFPEDPSQGGAQDYYNNSLMYNHQNTLVRAFFCDSLLNYAATHAKDGVLRILEIGAGSGSTAIQCIESLKEMKIPFHYTFTDISPLFLSEAKKKLINTSEVTYQLFNIEEDPFAQGFAPAEFDVVIGVQVIHATVNLSQSLINLKKVLKVNGLLILGEGFKPHPTHLFVFGMLDGWWRFQDFRLNSPMTALITEPEWEQLLSQNGFDNFTSSPGVIMGALAVRNASEWVRVENSVAQKKWLIFNDASQMCNTIASSLEAHEREVEVVDVSNTFATKEANNESYLNLGTKNIEHMEGILYFCTEFKETDTVQIQERIMTPLLNILQGYDKFAESLKAKPKIVLITRGVYNIGDSGPGNPNGATACAMMKVFKNEHPYINISLVDLDHQVSPFETEQVLSQLWSNDGECFKAFRNNRTYVLRLTYLEKPSLPVQLPSTDRFKFINPESGAFTDIEVGPRPKPEIVEDFVELEVRACALNFRDIFMVLKPEGFSLPDDNSLGTLDSVGLDLSGIVVAVGPKVTQFKVGDHVFGMTNDGALGSHSIAKESVLMKIPDSMTFVEACTIPCAFITAHVSLIEIAKITPEDRVLIHVATGGVGLASIQVVKEVGAEIYATAGSKRKRAYLRALGIKYVYHSRDTSYGELIERDTNGLGVTVALNSLTGPNFKETTLKICSPGARFVEIAKMNIWKPEEVEALRPDIQYTIVDLSTKESLEKCTRAGNGNAEVMAKIDKYVKDKIYTGLPSVVFQLSQVREAFYYFQKALHIGKVVVQIPEYTMSEAGKFEHKNYIFNDKSSYLITGGLGGIGVEVTKWMRTKGAKTIVLMGRSPPTPLVQRLIDQWNREGSNIVVIHGDVGEFSDCKSALEHIEKLQLPQLRGIMHAAGVLSDNFIANQTAASIQKVLRPKVHGGWYLHKLTMDYPMEFFVMFSSISGIFGMIGQCNHAGANRFLDALTHYRVAMGLPATTINWGGWSEVGAAAQFSTSSEVMSGFRLFTPSQGITALQNIITSREVQVAVSEVTDWNVVKNLVCQGRYLDEMKSENLDDRKFEKYDYLIEEIKAASSMEERQEKIQIYIEAILKQTLNLPDSEVLDIDQNFSELGVDSLMAMEMKNRFQAIIGNRTLSISSLQENRTIRSLSAHLASVMENEPIDTRPVAEQLLEDVILPPEITAAPQSAIKPSEFKSILLTGATGHLGIHCLVQTLESSSHLSVYCLIRAKTDEEAGERLEKVCAKYRITLNCMDRVIAIAGDVTKDRLGLTEENYEKLAEGVDSIFNCAAKANHLDGYSDGSRHDMRTHNVRGLVNILKFATHLKTKSLLHASTLFAATKLLVTESFTQVVEDFPEETDMASDMKWGYLLSKFVGEKLLREARNRGIPVKAIRFPFIFGNSKTGHMPVEHDHIWSTVLASIRTRMIPKGHLNGIPLIAVDEAAKVATHIFLSDEAEDGMYNLTVNSTSSEDLLKEGLAELGIPCEFVTFKEWIDAVFEEQDAKLMGPLASIYQDENGESRIYSLHGLSKETGNIDASSFTDKMIRNFPQIESTVTSAQVILHRQVEAHLAGGSL